MDLGLQGKLAIVTGGTANIGRAIVLALANEGASVLFTGRDAEAGAKVADLARENGAAAARFLAVDMLAEGAAQQIMAAAQAIGPVDVLINNVGGNSSTGLFVDTDPGLWQGDFDINMRTVLAMTHAVLPGMIERKGGAIVNLGSTAGIVGDYQLAVYSAMKGAVHAFTQVLAKEVGQHGVRVNCVAPYGTMSADPAAFSRGSRFNAESSFFASAFGGSSDFDKAMRGRQPLLQRTMPLGTPEEVAAMVVWLASSQASWVTGQICQVDGGALLR
ncbi:MAG: SDR family NAD(P)-dependent oxidoreductase [Novosphingobium sp.]